MKDFIIDHNDIDNSNSNNVGDIQGLTFIITKAKNSLVKGRCIYLLLK